MSSRLRTPRPMSTTRTVNLTQSASYAAAPVFYVTDLGPNKDPSAPGEVYQIDALGYGGTTNTVAVVESTFLISTNSATRWRQMIRKHLVVSITIVTGMFAMAFPYGTRAQNPIDDDFTQAVNPLPTTDLLQTTGKPSAAPVSTAGSWRSFKHSRLAWAKQPQSTTRGKFRWAATTAIWAKPPLQRVATRKTPDPIGSGALRFTNGYLSGSKNFSTGLNQFGGIISGNTLRHRLRCAGHFQDGDL